MPVSTTNAKPVNSRLLTRNAASRDSGESIRPGVCSWSPRHAIKPSPVTITPRKPSSHGADRALRERVHRGDHARAGEERAEDREANVAMISDRFQTRSMPRRSCTMTEWMNAVAVSHGSSRTRSRPGPSSSSRPSRAPRSSTTRRARCRRSGTRTR